MKKRNILQVLSITLVLLMVMSYSAMAVPGDCDGNTVLGISDMTILISYLFTGGPLPSMPDCDCDGFPGLNFGDLLQLMNYFYGSASFYGYPGLDVPVPSLAKFYYNVQVPGSMNNYVVNIYADIPTGFNISSFVLPFSFSQQTGTMQALLTLNSVSFTGTVVNGTPNAIIDNTNKTVLIYAYNNPGAGNTLAGGTFGLLCSLDFTSGPGTPNPITMTSTNIHWPMLLARDDYQGFNGVRVFLPAAIRAQYGDVNCDGSVNVSDAVYIINYVFVPLSPVPGSCEPPE